MAIWFGMRKRSFLNCGSNSVGKSDADGAIEEARSHDPRSGPAHLQWGVGAPLGSPSLFDPLYLPSKLFKRGKTSIFPRLNLTLTKGPDKVICVSGRF